MQRLVATSSSVYGIFQAGILEWVAISFQSTASQKQRSVILFAYTQELRVDNQICQRIGRTNQLLL